MTQLLQRIYLKGSETSWQWALEVLRTGSEAISSQEETNSRGLDIADAGGNAGGNNANFPLQPEPRYQQLLVHSSNGDGWGIVIQFAK